MQNDDLFAFRRRRPRYIFIPILMICLGFALILSAFLMLAIANSQAETSLELAQESVGKARILGTFGGVMSFLGLLWLYMVLRKPIYAKEV